MVSRRRSQSRATCAIARVASSRRVGSTRKRTSRPSRERVTSPACSSTARCLMTAWRVNGTSWASELAVAAPPCTSRSRTRRRDGSAIADQSSSPESSLIPRRAELRGERTELLFPAAPVVVGVAGLLVGGPAHGVETRLHDAQSRAFGTLGGEGEVDEDRPGWFRCPAGGPAPPEREPSRRVDRLDDDRHGHGLSRLPALERERAATAGLHVEL